ncbi:hypothetical protein H112_06428 [Trichophyton rubrum D6]|uniref:Uncharacterized protein n=3 Tax=Trichophyton TaxID=5550 RepID=A0A080WHC7_TRIRC|nr:uncharacterized protein TERG_11761 [Trichophyton rubrum CBS 118892]EZF13291.1 hypothetical protein H100_06442 [Trichophyton rubrum MR850]EZF39518.1 hypothetical protein H102_06408 [Trichophyton rubrum CBS 100081]EZF50347.1 hypothetical protein H103_06436 [Trichophyton rubrum CBS 288.86]EZF60976.1 hypothetical protein H104_06420 [Trichophyton rubrum CBS 289.86]EZF71493.1 hypothetical protein H105_06447 [Trichophyton soudanense CBS 452.61]EZF82304.1 hypothetical protein H110_06431 [Trichophy
MNSILIGHSGFSYCGIGFACEDRSFRCRRWADDERRGNSKQQQKMKPGCVELMTCFKYTSISPPWQAGYRAFRRMFTRISKRHPYRPFSRCHSSTRQENRQKVGVYFPAHGDDRSSWLLLNESRLSQLPSRSPYTERHTSFGSALASFDVEPKTFFNDFSSGKKRTKEKE